MSDILIQDGRILDANGERHADVLMRDGVIVEVAENITALDVRVLNAAGCYITPGLVDIHTHLREPGMEEAETIETGARAAALGGYTAILAMPNTTPPPDSAFVAEAILEKGRKTVCDVHVSGCITKGRAGEELADFQGLYELGVRGFNDDGDFVQDAALMRRALEIAHELPGVVIAQHAEDAELVKGGHLNEGAVSQALALTGRPEKAEAQAIARDLKLVLETGTRYHVLHVSTEQGIELIRQAKQEGLPVTCEVTPQHLVLTEQECASSDATYKINPPLRTENNVAVLRAALQDGTIDAIATDHAPHTSESKARPFEQAPPGMLGLETALGVVLTELVQPGIITMNQAIALLSWQPARIYGMHDQGGLIAERQAANICVIDPTYTWEVAATKLASKSQNTPWAGRKLSGKARHTICRGEAVVIDFEVQR